MKEILKLKEMLENAGIEFEFIDHSVGVEEAYQIIVRKSEEEILELCEKINDDLYERCTRVCSVIESRYSYGNDLDLLEIMGLTQNGEDVEGYLSAKEVYRRIIKELNTK